MIIRKKPHIPILASGGRPTLPIIPVKSLVLFPEEVVSLQLSELRNMAAVKQVVGKDRLVGVVMAPAGNVDDREIDLCQIGTAARVISSRSGPAGSEVVVLAGVGRIALESIRWKTSHLAAEISFIDENPVSHEELTVPVNEVISLVKQITGVDSAYSEELLSPITLYLENPGLFTDKIAAAFHIPINSKQEILESLDVKARLEKLSGFLEAELRQATAISAIESDSEKENAKKGKTSSLRPRLYDAEGRSCGESPDDEIIQQIKDRVTRNESLPDDVRNRCLFEIDRLNHLSTASAEYGATRRYLDWLAGIPWKVIHEENYELDQVEKEIDTEYYGSQSIKKRILERIAIRILSGRSDESSVLCLAGVPGTGKASLARAIAKALRKKFIRISVGGINDVLDIKGSARTFLGATPGLIIRTLKDVGTADPVILVENVDHFAEDSTVTLSMALLESIDPRWNSRFQDNFIGLPIDLSRVFFICTVKSVDDIPEIFSPRFEVVELPGYIEKEKIHIARKYIIPNALKKHGLLKKDVIFSEQGLRKIIRNFTLEAGLLNFKRRIESICRYAAVEKAAKVKKTWMVNEKTIESFLGTRQYIPEKPGQSPEIGVAIGLAWTGMGGDLMIIEGLKMKGSGEVITTGSLGEVMKESIQAAHSYVRSKADVLGIDHNDFENFDIHIHFPSGAIPKDGPSAGVAVSLVIASVMAERPIGNDIAMTGEVTLRGRVLQVGGLIEKVSAAYRAGIPKIFIPKENKKDLKDLPPDILRKTKFVFIESVDDVFTKGLLDFTPSSYTLEKLFTEELEKAKDRKRSSSARRIAAKGSKKK